DGRSGGRLVPLYGAREGSVAPASAVEAPTSRSAAAENHCPEQPRSRGERSSPVVPTFEAASQGFQQLGVAQPPQLVKSGYAERANLTMRMHNRRFTRLTNAFSKKFDNHAHMVAIYAVWYNWIRIHKSLRVTPAMAAGVSETIMNWADIIEAMDADQPTKKRGSYRKPQKSKE